MPNEDGLLAVRGIWPAHTGTNGLHGYTLDSPGFRDAFPGWWCTPGTTPAQRLRMCVECLDGRRERPEAQTECPSCPLRVAPGTVVARTVFAVYSPVGARIAVVAADLELHSESATVARLTVGRLAPSSRERLPWVAKTLIKQGPDWNARTLGVCTRDATVADSEAVDDLVDEVGESGDVHVYAEAMPYGAGGTVQPGAPDVLAALLGAWPDPDADPNATPVPTPWNGFSLDVGAVRGPKYAVDALTAEVAAFRAGPRRSVMNPETGDRHDALLLATAAAVYFARQQHVELTAQTDIDAACPVHEEAGLL
jgi:hypothetical protein